MIGVTAYGKTYKLRDRHKAGIGAPVEGPGLPGEYTTKNGVLSHYEVSRNNYLLQSLKYIEVFGLVSFLISWVPSFRNITGLRVTSARH